MMINLENSHSEGTYQLNNFKFLPISPSGPFNQNQNINYNQVNLPPPPSYQEVSGENDSNGGDFNNVPVRSLVSKPINRFGSRNSQREEKYRKIIRRHEISTDFSQKLQYLQGI